MMSNNNGDNNNLTKIHKAESREKAFSFPSCYHLSMHLTSFLLSNKKMPLKILINFIDIWALELISENASGKK